MEARHDCRRTFWDTRVWLDMDLKDSAGWLCEGPDLETDFGGEEGEEGECRRRRHCVNLDIGRGVCQGG